MADIEKTDRGFKIYGKVTDSRGCEVSVQESSIVGRPHVYVFTEDCKGVYRGTPPSPHLSVEQAKQLQEALGKFIADAESPDNWRNREEYKEMWG